MRRRSGQAFLSALLVAGALGSAGGIAAAQEATAQEPECARAMWAMPIETVELPDGWAWSSLTAQMDGGWSGSIEKGLPDSEGTSDFEDKTDDIYFDLECNPDPQAFMEARSRVRSVWPDRYGDVEAVEVGDQSVAFEYANGIGLDWAHGMVYGTVYGADSAGAAAIEDLALALDAVLP